MPIAKITRRGLAAISLAVAVLWTCVLGERVVAHQAYTERARVMRDLERLQRRQRPVPVSLPNPLRHHSPRLTAS